MWENAGKQDAIEEGRVYESPLDFVTQDADGRYFVDHLCVSQLDPDMSEQDLLEQREYLMSVHSLITTNIDHLAIGRALQAAETAKRQAKWTWYARYFNKAAAAFNQRLPANPISTFSLEDLFPSGSDTSAI